MDESRLLLLFLLKVMVVLRAEFRLTAFRVEAVAVENLCYNKRQKICVGNNPESVHFLFFLYFLSRYVLWAYVGWLFVLG